MHSFVKSTAVTALALTAVGAMSTATFAQTPVATYLFNNSLSAQQAGVAALNSVDPLGLNTFGTDTVFGSAHSVFKWNGTNLPTSDQAGLSLDTTGLLPVNNYSVEMVFEFTQRDNAWRRIIDVQNRQSDAGFYVDPSNNLDVYPVAGSSSAFTNNVFHHVVLTDSSTGTAVAFLDGIQQFSLSTTVMDINNPGNVMNFFLDNVIAGGQGEFSNGEIALMRLYDHPLTSNEVKTLAGAPLPVPVAGTAVPESGTLALAALGLLPLGSSLIRRRRTV